MKSTRSAVIGFLFFGLLASSSAQAGVKLAQKIQTSKEVFRELLDTPDKKVPRELLERARCIVVIPGVIKGALGWGGKHGRGIVSCRSSLDTPGEWSAPVFVRVSGGSFGFQVGAQATDVVLFLMSEASIRSLLKSQFMIGGDVTVAAGPLGRSAELGTDVRLRAEIYSYAKSRGFFAGVSIEGARLAPHDKSNRRYYGEQISPREVLVEQAAIKMPREARSFVAALP